MDRDSQTWSHGVCAEKVTFRLKSRLFRAKKVDFEVKSNPFQRAYFFKNSSLLVSPENTRSSPLMRARVSTDLLHMSSSSFSCSPFFLLLNKSTSCRVKCTVTKIPFMFSFSGNCAASVPISQFHFGGYINGTRHLYWILIALHLQGLLFTRKKQLKIT
jgi:hypothetical protein